MPEMGWPNEFWKEAIWEGVCDNLDREVRKIVNELIDSYTVKDLLRQMLSLHTVMSQKDAEPVAARSLSTKWKFSDLKEKVTDFIKKIPVFKQKIPSFIGGFLDLVLDLPLYLGEAYGPQMREEVEKTIRGVAEKTDGIVVVGHSLGSVIAHDVVAKMLTETNPLPIQALVTMGSPLEWVNSLRMKARGIPEIPAIPKTLQWLNFYNAVDPVPLKRELPKTIFHVKNFSISAGTLNPLEAHSAYWTDGKVAGLIRDIVYLPEHATASRSGLTEANSGVVHHQ